MITVAYLAIVDPLTPKKETTPRIAEFDGIEFRVRADHIHVTMERRDQLYTTRIESIDESREDLIDRLLCEILQTKRIDLVPHYYDAREVTE